MILIGYHKSHNIVMNVDAKSKRLYVRGINKLTKKLDIENHFKSCGILEKIEFDDDNRKGFCWVEYEEQESADAALATIHLSDLNGTSLDLRYDNRMRKTNFSIEKKIKPGKNLNMNCVQCSVRATNDKDRSYYTSDGLIVNDVEYPMPTGRYLVRVLRLCHSSSQLTAHHFESKPLLDILTEPRHGNKHSKELTESIAMVDAIYRLGHLIQKDWDMITHANVYVVADGRTPYTMAALALFLPKTWHFVSIDPLLDFDGVLLGNNQHRCHLVSALSQDYTVVDYCKEHSTAVDNIHTSDSIVSYNIVIACHSHAPLQEFWDRIPSPKCGVVMPCCGKDWSNLSLTSIDSYEDYEVYSPKRKIHLYNVR